MKRYPSHTELVNKELEEQAFGMLGRWQVACCVRVLWALRLEEALGCEWSRFLNLIRAHGDFI